MTINPLGSNQDPARNNWRTPPILVERIARRYGVIFDLDIAASVGAEVAGTTFVTDGLSEWEGRHIWCNPPYSNIRAWIETVLRGVNEGRCETATLLLPAGTDTAWFAASVKCESAYEVALLTPRVQFIPPEGVPKSSNPRGSCVVHLKAQNPRIWPALVLWDWSKAT